MERGENVVPPLYRRRVLDALFPLVCPGCGRGCGRRGSPVCVRCEPGLRHALPAHPPAGVDAWWAAFAYEGVAREVVARLCGERPTGPILRNSEGRPWTKDAIMSAPSYDDEDDRGLLRDDPDGIGRASCRERV